MTNDVVWHTVHAAVMRRMLYDIIESTRVVFDVNDTA